MLAAVSSNRFVSVRGDFEKEPQLPEELSYWRNPASLLQDFCASDGGAPSYRLVYDGIGSGFSIIHGASVP